MTTGKTSTRTFSFEPLRRKWHTAADREHRSIANMVEVMIRDCCERNGVTISEQGALFNDGQKPVKRSK